MINSWPETPFEESMLGNDDIIIHCPNEDLARELFDIFINNGIEWGGSTPLTRTYWKEYGEDTCYRVEINRKIRYCSIYFYSGDEYDDHIRCTFYGGQLNSDPIDETEWMSILGFH